MRLRVIGLGSPHGDDAVGLQVAQRLALEERLPGGADALARDRPGVDLVDDLRGQDGVVLVDAADDALAPGVVREADARALLRGPDLSSHGFGAAAALALADALGALPPRLRVVAIGIDPRRAGGLSAATAAAIPLACAAARRALEAMAADGDARRPRA